jgi:hypothetical protein
MFFETKPGSPPVFFDEQGRSVFSEHYIQASLATRKIRRLVFLVVWTALFSLLESLLGENFAVPLGIVDMLVFYIAVIQ